jgi:hypothetical protein
MSSLGDVYADDMVGPKDVDTTNTDPAYWDKILSQDGLGENKGRHNRWLVYGHDYNRPPDDTERCGGGKRTKKHQTLNQIEKDEI